MPKWWRRLCAWLGGTFWLPCYVCDYEFSGSEWERAGFLAIKLSIAEGRAVCSAACIERWKTGWEGTID